MENNSSETVQLIDLSYKNNLFNENISYFKEANKSVYESLQGYQPSTFRLFLNKDGSPNIVDMTNGQALYNLKTQGQIAEHAERQVRAMERVISPQHYFDLDNEQALRQSPIQTKLYRELSKAGPLNSLDWDNISITQGSNYCPLVRAYGIGLGYQLTELIKQRDVTHLIIYEPEVDLFFLSLYTIPWKLIFEYFELTPTKDIKLLVGISPKEAEKHTEEYLTKTFRYLPLSYYRLTLFNNSRKIDEIIHETAHADDKMIMHRDMGWYEDQRAGLFYGMKNIIRKKPLYNGGKINQDLRVFVIGTGPSLDDALPYIKEHQDSAIIFSSGSAITPLLNYGIIPDFQILQERYWEDFEERHDKNQLKKIDVIQLNVVRHDASDFYRNGYMALKINDPSIALFKGKYPGLSSSNPTVTNMSISLASSIGANEIYLFGVDYGAPIDAEHMHAKNSVYDESCEQYINYKEKDGIYEEEVEKQKQIEIPGNFSKTIATNHIYSWSKDVTEIVINKNPEINYINVGDGAKIKGALEKKINELPKKLGSDYKKSYLIDEIRNLFDTDYLKYNPIEGLERQINEEIKIYFDAIIQFANSTPETREEMLNVLTLMSYAIDNNAYDQEFLPPLLMSGGLMHFIKNVYIQLTLIQDDNEISGFFMNCMDTLSNYLERMHNDVIYLIQGTINGNIQLIDSGTTPEFN